MGTLNYLSGWMEKLKQFFKVFIFDESTYVNLFLNSSTVAQRGYLIPVKIWKEPT